MGSVLKEGKLPWHVQLGNFLLLCLCFSLSISHFVLHLGYPFGDGNSCRNCTCFVNWSLAFVWSFEFEFCNFPSISETWLEEYSIYFFLLLYHLCVYLRFFLLYQFGWNGCFSPAPWQWESYALRQQNEFFLKWL